MTPTEAASPTRTEDERPAFGPDSAIRRVTRERAVLIYGPAAAVLQVAHPLVAAGVRDHSTFTQAPLVRLHRTLEATYAISFGTVRDARRTADGIACLHGRVRGNLDEPSRKGQFSDSADRTTPASLVRNLGPYAASDPDLVMWVTATLTMGAVEAHERFVGRLSYEDKESFHADMRRFGRHFGLPPGHGPRTWPAFVDYYEATLADERLGSHPVSRAVAWAVATPRHPFWLRPAGLPGQMLLAETLPEAVGSRLGFRRTAASRAAFAAMARALRRVIPVLPDRLRYAPAHLKAVRREATVP